MTDSQKYQIRGIAFGYLLEIDKAIGDFYQAIQIEPNYFETYFYRGILYLKQENYSLALDDFNKSIEFEPQFAENYNYRASLYLKIGDLGKYGEDLDKYNALRKKK